MPIKAGASQILKINRYYKASERVPEDPERVEERLRLACDDCIANRWSDPPVRRRPGFEPLHSGGRIYSLFIFVIWFPLDIQKCSVEIAEL